MLENKKKLLTEYFKLNVAPILIDFMEGKDILNAVTIPASIDITELNGHYEGDKYLPPSWLNEILNNKKNMLLVIDNIDSISIEEQVKFVEILKYRKVSTFNLPDDCRIIVTAKEINEYKINQEIYSLLAQIY